MLFEEDGRVEVVACEDLPDFEPWDEVVAATGGFARHRIFCPFDNAKKRPESHSFGRSEAFSSASGRISTAERLLFAHLRRSRIAPSAFFPSKSSPAAKTVTESP